MSTKTSDFAKNLKHFRQQKGYTLKEFASLLDTQMNNLARWERGVVEPKIYIVARMAEALGVSIDQLCGVANASDTPELQRLYTKLQNLSDEDLAFVSGFVERL